MPTLTPTGRTPWTDKRIETELRALAEDGRFPTNREMRAKPGLAEAVRRRGGATTWAPKLGLKLAPAGRRRTWTDERIETELPALAKNGRFPTHDELKAGPPGLADAVRRSGGARKWAPRLGLESSASGGPRTWTDERIKRELRALAKNGRFPTSSAMRTAAPGLAEAVWRTGGAQVWRRRLGLEPATGNAVALDAEPAPLPDTVAELEREIDRLTAEINRRQPKLAWIAQRLHALNRGATPHPPDEADHLQTAASKLGRELKNALQRRQQAAHKATRLARSNPPR